MGNYMDNINTLMDKINKIGAFIKRRKYLLILAVLIIAVISFYLFKDSAITHRTAEAQIGRIEQAVSATGRVQKSDKVDLGFSGSGRVSWIGVKVGDKVKSGQTLAMIDLGELGAQRDSAQAAVDSAKAKLDQLMAGPRLEDLQVSQTNYDNALKALNDTSTRNSIDVSGSSINVATSAMVTFTDIQSIYFTQNSSEDIDLANHKASVLQLIYDKSDLGRAASWYFLELKTGLIGRLTEQKNNPSADQIKLLLTDTRTALNGVKSAMDSIYSRMNGVSTTDSEKNKIISARSNVISQISSITAQEQAVVSAESVFNNAKAQLDLKKAPTTTYDVEIVRAQLKQAEASLAMVNAQISRNIIYSPINGIVSLVDIQRGEIVSPGKTSISVLGNSNYEITSNIPEADISKVNVGNTAKVTLDAFGQDFSWEAKVTSIYPAEKMIDGVPTYETKLQFVESDERIRSGLTANMDILNDMRDGVLVIPTRAIYQRDGQKYVKIVVANQDDAPNTRFANLSVATRDDVAVVYEMPITTGLKGSDGKTEIVSGLVAGDKILIQ